MPRYGARSLTVTAAQAAVGSELMRGPIRVVGWSFADGTIGQGLTVRGSANAPGAGVTVTTISLANGEYVVEWSVELTGTPGVADIDNVKLNIGATQVATSVNLGAVGNYPQEEATIIVSGGPLSLTAAAIAAATAGSVYVVNMTITPITASLGTINDGGQLIANVGAGPGGTDTQFLSENGVAVRTRLFVQATQGVVSGVIWYYLAHDKHDEGTAFNTEEG